MQTMTTTRTRNTTVQDAPDLSPPAITARGLTRAFGDVHAVDGLDLTIERGEIYGLLGPNGAGKSTTVKMLCTLLAPTGGQATVAGFDIAERPQQVRLHIGVALQDVALDPKQTGLELLRLQGQLYGLTRKDIERRLVDLRALVDLGDALDRRIETYSGGMRRRLDLAAALVHNPDVLFLDEPTTGLDPISRARVWQEVQRLNDELGMTILLTTQYLEEADELADRVGIVDHGTLVAEGTPNELKRSIGTDVVVARIEGDADAARHALHGVYGVAGVEGRDHELTISVDDGSSAIGPIAIAFHDASIRVRDLTLRTPTLDDVFLELTGAHFDAEEDQS
jgi:ABC-2 type transport system ATP-binding protein